MRWRRIGDTPAAVGGKIANDFSLDFVTCFWKKTGMMEKLRALPENRRRFFRGGGLKII